RGAGVAAGGTAAGGGPARVGGVRPPDRGPARGRAGEHGDGVQAGADGLRQAEAWDGVRGTGAGGVGDGLPGARGTAGEAAGGSAGLGGGRAGHGSATVVRETKGRESRPQSPPEGVVPGKAMCRCWIVWSSGAMGYDFTSRIAPQSMTATHTFSSVEYWTTPST